MKSKFIKSTIILLIGGFVTKVLGMFIRIIMTRLLGPEGIGTYMMIIPTFSLLIALAQLGFPIAISKLVAEEKRNNKNLIFSIIPVSLMINLVIMLVLFFSSRFIANNLLHEPNTYYGLRSMGFVLPFISISSILRGYFFGKQRMFPHIISNITEDIIRLIIMIIGIPIFLIKGIEYAIAFIIISNIICELSAIIVLFLFLPKNFKITKQDIKPDKVYLKDIFNISIPSTASRLIGNFGYFFEPIIITSFLLYSGYSSNFITVEYGIITGYILPLLLLPAFFTMAISQALIPVVSKNYLHRKKRECGLRIKQAIIFSLLIGIPSTLIFILVPEIPLKLIYNTTEGIGYLKVLAPIFLLFYVQAPLASTLQAMGKGKHSFYGTLIGIIIKTVILLITCLMHIGMWALVIATAANILFVTIYDIYSVKKELVNS